ncbi:hypothetical protein [Burkholderia pseudomallei]|uniref:hypothetical protein n=1 Tax=Burkholderia pseudomallei TaxID=28450 RepID=UPI00117772A8|nr:hypothetical protein [Burkholderia pseudomallei]
MSKRMNFPELEVSSRGTVVTAHPSMSREPVAFVREEFAHLTPLFAAAPDLLVVARDFEEALRELDMFCECGEVDCRTTRLRAAIAKATGDQ